MLPQKDPLFYKSFKTNYNVPELITGAVKIDPIKLLEAARGEAKPVKVDKTFRSKAKTNSTEQAEEDLH